MIWIFGVGGQAVGWTGIEGTLRGPRGPKKGRRGARLFYPLGIAMVRFWLRDLEW